VLLKLGFIEPDRARQRAFAERAKKALGGATLALCAFSGEGPFLYAVEERGFRADIVLLPAGEAGFAVGRRLRRTDRNCAVVYLDGDLDMVLGAFAACPIAYLLPDPDRAALGNALGMAEKYLLGAALANEARADAVRFRHETRLKLISLRYADIDYFESDLRRVTIHMADKSTDSFAGKLDDVEAECLAPFFRAHQSYLVNLNHVERLIRAERRILFYSGNQAYASRQAYPELCRRMTEAEAQP
jgi:DNA-binding LytR/AlgR family response regulator